MKDVWPWLAFLSAAVVAGVAWAFKRDDTGEGTVDSDRWEPEQPEWAPAPLPETPEDLPEPDNGWGPHYTERPGPQQVRDAFASAGRRAGVPEGYMVAVASVENSTKMGPPNETEPDDIINGAPDATYYPGGIRLSTANDRERGIDPKKLEHLHGNAELTAKHVKVLMGKRYVTTVRDLRGAWRSPVMQRDGRIDWTNNDTRDMWKLSAERWDAALIDARARGYEAPERVPK